MILHLVWLMNVYMYARVLLGVQLEIYLGGRCESRSTIIYLIKKSRIHYVCVFIKKSIKRDQKNVAIPFLSSCTLSSGGGPSTAGGEGPYQVQG